MKIKISVEQIRAMAHATVMHYNMLERQEGKLPPREQAVRSKANTIDAMLNGASGRVEIEIEEA